MLARKACGRVLDLGGAGSHAALWDNGPVTDIVNVDGFGLSGLDEALDTLVARGEEFDTVFSVFRLIGVFSLVHTLRQLEALLSPEGQILFLEPGRLTGALGGAQRLAALPVGLATGWRLDRDIPAQLRAAGLSVTDIEHHRSRTLQVWLRTLLEGTAQRALDLPRPR